MAGFTEEAIRESFLKLLEEHPLSSITVKEIVADCGINRNTFYYHFQDIPSLLERIIEDDCNRIISENTDPDSLESCLLMAAGLAENRRKQILHIYDSDDRQVFEAELWKLCGYAVQAFLRGFFIKYNVGQEQQDFLLRYYKGVCFGITMEYLESGMSIDIRPYIRWLCAIKQGQIEELLEKMGSED